MALWHHPLLNVAFHPSVILVAGLHRPGAFLMACAATEEGHAGFSPEAL